MTVSGRDNAETLQYFRPGFNVAHERLLREDAGLGERIEEQDLYPDVRSSLTALQGLGLRVLSEEVTPGADEHHRTASMSCPYWTISRCGPRCFQKPLRSRSRRKANNELPKLTININVKKAKFAFRLVPNRLIEQRFVPRQENPHLHTGVKSIEFLQSPQAIGRLGVQHKPTCGFHRAVVGQHASENCRRVAKSSELVHSPLHVTAEPLYELRMLCRRTHNLPIARQRRGVSTPITPVRCDDSAPAAVALRCSATGATAHPICQAKGLSDDLDCRVRLERHVHVVQWLAMRPPGSFIADQPLPSL
ncbi:hypothetical protein SAMN04488564_117125 [Lentzea waywayandensis]|uniref:Uncharacterized protein n=1 Tax=Lentzea waywayandensis TaxID=84724 RepID=A0A1I6FGY5_9PSEU|nr:hypothetical protein SAMN04488564_117125 [Lentzea waywayandensis]